MRREKSDDVMSVCRRAPFCIRDHQVFGVLKHNNHTSSRSALNRISSDLSGKSQPLQLYSRAQ